MLSTPGRIIVLSAPSGGGKSTLAKDVLRQTLGLVRSVTYTTRPRREEEVDGRDYHFISAGEFEVRALAGDFLEFATVHGHCYGTSRSDIEQLCAQGLDVLLIIDYQGAAAIRSKGLAALYVFILPPSMATLQQRLRQRNSEDESALQQRLAMAPIEMQQYRHYDYVIVNDDLAVATQQLQAIVIADRCRVQRLRPRYPIFVELELDG